MMGYVGVFGVLYFSQVEIGGVSIARFRGFMNALLFSMPIWIASVSHVTSQNPGNLRTAGNGRKQPLRNDSFPQSEWLLL